MTRKRRRMLFVAIGMLMLGSATALVLNALQGSLAFFYGPTAVIENKDLPAHFRLGGLVEKGSIIKDVDGLTVHFRVTDLKHAMPVVYRGLLPDLFREGQGVVVEGGLQPDGSFLATTVLAKHDEKYMPPEVAAALKKAGEWRPDNSAGQSP